MDIKKLPAHQWCIKAKYFSEVMSLPNEAVIEELSFNIGWTMKQQSILVSPALKALGVTYMRKSKPSLDVQGTMKCKSRSQYKANIDKICEDLGVDKKGVLVKRMVIRAGSSTASFSKTTKRVTDQDGNNHVEKVLALFSWDGDENEIIKALSSAASKFKCKYDSQFVRTVQCEEE